MFLLCRAGGAGLCGGFTTFAAVVLEGSAILGADFPVPALGYAVLTVALCLGAVVLGLLGGRRLAQPALPDLAQDEEESA